MDVGFVRCVMCGGVDGMIDVTGASVTVVWSD